MASKCHDILPNLTKVKGQAHTGMILVRVYCLGMKVCLRHFLDWEWNLQIMQLLLV